MPAAKDCVGVVDDDAAVRRSLCLMLEGLGMEVRAYASARDYLDDAQGRASCVCLVLDVRLPDISGIALQKQLMTQKHGPAIVFVTGHGDVPMAVQAMRNGAIDFLQKPFMEQQLVDSVQRAIASARSSRQARHDHEIVTARLACLTPRETQVLAGMKRGLRTKAIAAELGLATRTAEEHRANLMHKMHASTVAELISMCNAG
jgi:FixJ family two-component response regulator